MGFSFKNWLHSTIGALFPKTAKTAGNHSLSLRADRLLVDAIQLSELPSPAPGEEPRAAFVLERLKSCNLLPEVTSSGDIKVRLHCPQAVHEEPILLFTDLGSRRWHPAESLARLDPQYASGAGLSDSLGSAALLSIAEQWQSGDYQNYASNTPRDILLLFTAKSLDDPAAGIEPSLHSAQDIPYAAIGVRGLSLDRIIRSTGSYRLKIVISAGTQANKKENEAASNKVTETLIDTARTLLGIAWDTDGKTKLFIRRLEAQTVYASTPQEGLVELELESSEAPLLEMALNAVKATAGKIGDAAGLAAETTLLSYTPPGNSENSRMLNDALGRLLRERHIKVREETAADPAAFFTAAGIPALSVGMALGREGTERDLINISSIADGLVVLEKLIAQAGAKNDTGSK